MRGMAKRPYGTGCVFQRGRIWWIKYSPGDGAKPVFESSKSTDEGKAKKLLAQRTGQVASGEFFGISVERATIKDVVQLVVDDYKLMGKRDLQNVEWRINKHIVPKLGLVLAKRFGAAHVKRYINERRAGKAENATINRELSIIRHGFTLAMRLEPPMVARAPHILKLEEDNARQGFVEHEQYRTLLNALPSHLKCLLVVGYHVGNRLGELRNLEWSQVDLNARQIRLTAAETKGKKARTIPIYGDMIEWLQIQRETRDQKYPGCQWVFHYYGRRLGSHLKGWPVACDVAGLPGLHFHDLRRSAVRNLTRAGVPRPIAMAITGHRSESVYSRYDIVSPQDLTIATEKVQRYFEGQEQEQKGQNPPVRPN